MSEISQLRQIKTIFFVVLVGLVLMGLGAYFFVRSHGVLMTLTASQNNTLESSVFLFVLIGIPVSYYIHKRKMGKMDLHQNVGILLNIYKSSFFTKLAVLEGLGFFTLLAYILSANSTFLLMLTILLIVLLVNFPTIDKVADEMNIEDKESFFNN